jgi:acetoin utilization deacetylase AcuC-like enzyme
MVFERCRAAGVPVAVVMAGGYGRDVREAVSLHLQTTAEARRCWKSWPNASECSRSSRAGAR